VETPGIANEEENQAVHKWLRDQPKTFFVEGIRKLAQVHRKGRRLCRKMAYFFNPYLCVNKLEKQKCG
jgi:hypothetical protein